ncbi:MAG: chloride channel protein, partial [Bacteroidetes bacterium]
MRRWWTFRLARALALLHRLLLRLEQTLSPRNYEIVVAMCIGAVAGLAAVILKHAIEGLREWAYGPDPTSARLAFVVLPIVGILLTWLYLRYGLRKPITVGLPDLIYQVTHHRIRLPFYEMYAHAISSSLTVGFGGSAGLEAPIIRTGAALGYNLGAFMQSNQQRRTLFLACGAAGGMASIFNSPIAAVIFAFEVILGNVSVHSFIPLLIASASGAVVARVFHFQQLFILYTDQWELEQLPVIILIGLACGLVATYHLWIVWQVHNSEFARLSFWRKLLIGGIGLGCLIYLMPPLFGEGYDAINALLFGEYDELVAHSPFYSLSDNHWFLLLFALMVLLAKGISSALTIVLGGNGGEFAPTMFVGAMTGFIISYGLNLAGLAELSVSTFVALAMAGAVSGVYKAPLSAIFLIAEMTGGYGLFVPLMIVSALSYFVCMYFEPYSIVTKPLAHRGVYVAAHERDKHVLAHMQLDELVERNFSLVRPDWTMGEFVRVIAHSRRNVFPVVDEDGNFLGVILLDDVRHLMFDTTRYDSVRVKDLMHAPPATIELDEPMEKVMEKFERTGAWNLPVV